MEGWKEENGHTDERSGRKGGKVQEREGRRMKDQWEAGSTRGRKGRRLNGQVDRQKEEAGWREGCLHSGGWAAD